MDRVMTAETTAKGDLASESDLRVLRLGIAEASALLKTGELSPVDLVRVYLDRIDALNPTLHAYITVTRDAALEEARIAEHQIQAGDFRGALQGIPIAHKDLLWTRGTRTTAHSRLLEHWVPEQDATVVARLRAAGAICLGKTALHEFACGTPGPGDPFPAARNPWNIDHSPGSSSSGSAAAVAGGLCLGATGTDTGGSIAHPSMACGIVGMKPTFGRVSKFGVIPLAQSLDHVGPMTKTVIDNAVMLQAMAGHDPEDPHSANVGVPDFSAAIGASIHQVRVGIPWRFIRSLPHTDETIRVFNEALNTLESLGAQIREIDVTGIDLANDVTNLILLYEAYQYHKRNLAERPGEFGEIARMRLMKGAAYTEADYSGALKQRAAIRIAYRSAFASEVDVIASPAREGPADSLADMKASPTRRSATNRMYNLTGMPVLTLSMGFSASGLPLGFTIAGDHFNESMLYQVGHAYETATPWHLRLPVTLD